MRKGLLSCPDTEIFTTYLPRSTTPNMTSNCMLIGGGGTMTSTSCNMWQETSESTSVTYHYAVGLAGQLLYLASQNRWAGACKAFSSSHYYFQNI